MTRKRPARLLSLLLTLCMVLTLLPTVALAATHEGDLSFSADTADVGDLAADGYHWDQATLTLTIKDLTLTTATWYRGLNLFAPDKTVTLVVQGSNSITCSGNDTSGFCHGIYANTAELVIKGDGTLAATADGGTSQNTGIYASGTLTLAETVSVTAVGKTPSSSGGAYGLMTPTLTVGAGATLTAEGKNASDTSIGISLPGSEASTIHGTVTATAGTASNYSYGIDCNDLTLADGAEVTVTASVANSFGLHQGTGKKLTIGHADVIVSGYNLFRSTAAESLAFPATSKLEGSANADGTGLEDGELVGGSFMDAATKKKFFKYLKITADPALGFINDGSYDIPANAVGAAIDAIDLNPGARGGSGSYTFAKTGGPDWLAVSAAGVITGTPTAAAGDTTLTITLNDGVSTPVSITLNVGAVSSGYKITLDPNGGTLDGTGVLITGSDGKLSDISPTAWRSGEVYTYENLPIYVFDGWYTAQKRDTGEKVTTDTVFTDHTTLYAHWRYDVKQDGALTDEWDFNSTVTSRGLLEVDGYHWEFQSGSSSAILTIRDLTVNNTAQPYGISVSAYNGVTIIVEGTNSITGGDSAQETKGIASVYALTIGGSGTLTATAGTTTASAAESTGIRALKAITLIDTVTVNAIGGGGYASCGVRAPGQLLTVEADATLHVATAEATGHGHGINTGISEGGVVINGTLTADIAAVGGVGGTTEGIDCHDFTLGEYGDAKITMPDVTTRYTGLEYYNTMTVKGGRLEIIGGVAPVNGHPSFSTIPTIAAGLSIQGSVNSSGTPLVEAVFSGTNHRLFQAGTANSLHYILISGTALGFKGSPAYDVPASHVDEAITPINLVPGLQNGVSPFTFEKVGTTPSWLKVSSAGVVSGTPTGAEEATTAKIKVTDRTSPTPQSIEFTINVGAVTFSSVTVSAVSVKSTTHKTEYTVGDTLDVSNLTLSVEWSNYTNTTVLVTADMVSGFDSSAATAEQTLTITYGGKTTTYKISIAAAPTKTVSVGLQSGTLIAGLAGSVTFPVTTANIPDGIYTATVANRPTGVTVSGSVVISDGTGTLTLAGNTSTVVGTTDTLTLTLDSATSASFSLTVSPAVVNIAVIPGVTVPVAGATPVTAISETAQYTGTVSWGGSLADGKFGYSTVYTATITLTAKPGYTLTGVSTNFFTVAGTSSSATNSANSGVITAVFPATGTVPVKTVSVGSQSGTLTVGTAGSVTFPVTTVNIADGTYTVSVANLPTGVSVSGDVTISGGSGTLTLAGDTSTVAATTSTLTLTLDSTTSAAFSLAVSATPPTVVSIKAIPGVTLPVAGATPVTTITATDQYTGTVSWSGSLADGKFDYATAYTATITLSAKPGYTLTGVTANSFTVVGATTVTHAANSGEITAVFPATEAAPVKTVSVGTQSGTLTAGTSGTVTFPVTTANIADGTYTVTVANRPTGVTISGSVVISSNSGTLTLAGGTTTAVGTTSNLTLTIDGATSEAFTLTVAPVPTKTVSVGTQSGTLTAGTAGTVTFPVTTANIADGTYTVTVANRPTGVTVSGSVVISGNSGTLTLAGGTTTVFGTTSNLTLTIDGATSGAFSLTVSPAVVSIMAIPGVTKPVAGATPVYAITETDQYTGIITWSGTPTTFGYATSYTATITLSAKPGYTFTGVAANSFTVEDASSVTHAANSGTITAVFPATADQPINITAIGGVTPPVPGETPVSTVTATAQYTGSIVWSGALDGGKFDYETAYTATITLTPKTGYTLTGVAADSFTVAGATTANAPNSGVITAVFPATGSASDTTVNLLALEGITAPVAGATPVTTVTTTDQYTGTVTWAPADNPFGYATAYTATITLMPKTGFTLAGVTADSFMVASASSVSNAANSGVITAVFPATEAAPVKIVSVGTQTGTMTEGTADAVTYTVTTANIPDGIYPISVANLPTGVSAAVSMTINGNAGTLTLTGSGTTMDGSTGTLTLTVDGVTSAAFTLTVASAAPTTHAVTVNGSYAGTSGAGNYAPTATVTINAGTRSNYTFAGWTVNSGGVTLASASNATTTFTMPTNAVTVTASWTYNGSSGGGTSTPSKTDTEKAVENIEKAKDGDTVKIDLGTKTEVKKEVFEAIAGKDITVEITVGEVVWVIDGKDVPKTGLTDLNLGVSVGSNTIPVDIINAVTGEKVSIQIELKHDGPFGFTMLLQVPLGKESAGLYANLYFYNKTTSEMEFRTASQIGADGNVEISFNRASEYAIVIDNSVHGEEGWSNPFTDVRESDWFYNDVAYVYAAGLMTGTAETLFSPGTETSRAMIVTILYRLEGEPAVTEKAGFADVPTGTWYANAVAWAQANGIVKGYSAEKFGPNDPITREQIAVILANYAKLKGYDVSASADLSTFSDTGSVSSWAIDAITWASAEALISGKGGGILDPRGNATRAEVAAILTRFCENIVK